MNQDTTQMTSKYADPASHPVLRVPEGQLCAHPAQHPDSSRFPLQAHALLVDRDSTHLETFAFSVV